MHRLLKEAVIRIRLDHPPPLSARDRKISHPDGTFMPPQQVGQIFPDQADAITRSQTSTEAKL
jgi:hypothetical protein